jgi:nucleotide-binding universal stress UspA family protein
MGFASLMDMAIYCLHIGGKQGKWEKLKMEGLKEYFHNTYSSVTVECEILEQKENKLQAIDNYIQANNINIISLTTRKRNIIERLFIPSLTRRLFYHTNIPLLVFHT